MKVAIDTNIALDVLARRNFSEESNKVPEQCNTFNLQSMNRFSCIAVLCPIP